MLCHKTEAMSDDYARAYVKGDGDALHREKFPVPKYFLAMSLFAPISMAAMMIGVAKIAWPMAFGIALVMGAIAFAGNLVAMGLRIAVSRDGVDVHAGMRRHHIALGDIVGAAAAPFSLKTYPLGRGHMKIGTRGRAFVGSAINPFAGDAPGVELQLRNGKTCWIASHDPTAFLSALERARHPAGKRIDATPDVESMQRVDPSPSPEPLHESAERSRTSRARQ